HRRRRDLGAAQRRRARRRRPRRRVLARARADRERLGRGRAAPQRLTSVAVRHPRRTDSTIVESVRGTRRWRGARARPTVGLMAADAPPAPALEPEIRALGRSLDAAFPSAARRPRAAAEDRLTARLARRPELRAALFRLVDVAPACRT